MDYDFFLDRELARYQRETDWDDYIDEPIEEDVDYE